MESGLNYIVTWFLPMYYKANSKQFNFIEVWTKNQFQVIFVNGKFHLEWKLLTGVVYCYTYLMGTWDNSIRMFNSCDINTFLQNMSFNCWFEHNHSTFLAHVVLVKDIHALGALLAGKYASLHSILVSAEKSPGTYA